MLGPGRFQGGHTKTTDVSASARQWHDWLRWDHKPRAVLGGVVRMPQQSCRPSKQTKEPPVLPVLREICVGTRIDSIHSRLLDREAGILDNIGFGASRLDLEQNRHGCICVSTISSSIVIPWGRGAVIVRPMSKNNVSHIENG